jgi:hypothetical protein
MLVPDAKGVRVDLYKRGASMEVPGSLNNKLCHRNAWKRWAFVLFRHFPSGVRGNR